MGSGKKRARERKREEVERLKQLLNTYRTVATVNFRGLRSKPFQQIRRDLRDKCLIRVSKNSLIHLSLKESGVDDMIPCVADQTALVFSNLDPFELYDLIERSKKPAPIKAGVRSPRDIVVEAGRTSLKPGPIIGELQRAGIPAGIEGGNIVIRKQTVVVREGEVVSREVADVLAKLGIYPMEEGLQIQAIYDREAGVLFLPDVLRTKPEELIEDVLKCAEHAFNIAFNMRYEYPTNLTVSSLLAEAEMNAVNLALNANYPTRKTIHTIIQDAHARALSLALNACIYTEESIPLLLAKAASAAKLLAERFPE